MKLESYLKKSIKARTSLNPYMVILQRIDNFVKCVIMYTKQKIYENYF